jgi:hypothetical protein
LGRWARTWTSTARRSPTGSRRWSAKTHPAEARTRPSGAPVCAARHERADSEAEGWCGGRRVWDTWHDWEDVVSARARLSAMRSTYLRSTHSRAVSFRNGAHARGDERFSGFRRVHAPQRASGFPASACHRKQNASTEVSGLRRVWVGPWSVRSATWQRPAWTEVAV